MLLTRILKGSVKLNSIRYKLIITWMTGDDKLESVKRNNATFNWQINNLPLKACGWRF